jgi:hypothetical protein
MHNEWWVQMVQRIDHKNILQQSYRSRAVEHDILCDGVLAAHGREHSTALLGVQPEVMDQVAFNPVEPWLVSAPACLFVGQHSIDSFTH